VTGHALPITGAEGVAYVIAKNAEYTMGIPGGYVMRIFDALRTHQADVRTILVREESLGTVMAEAIGRVTNRPAVVLGQGAWVLGNAGIGIMEAHLASSPMVVLVDATDGGDLAHHGPYQSGSGDYGAYDLRSAMAAITKRTFYALTAAQAVQMTQLAFKHATTGEPGPVAVVFRSNSLMDMLDLDSAPRPRLDASTRLAAKSQADPDQVDEAAAAVRRATRPVIIAGNGIRQSNAYAALAEFAESTNIPVATTAAGKSVLPETHALAAGVIGVAGLKLTNSLVGSADLVIAVGTKLGATDTAQEDPALIDPDRQVLVQIDVEPLNVQWTQPIEHQLVGDAGETLAALGKHLQGYDGNGLAVLEAARSEFGWFEALPPSADGVGGRRVAQILASALPPDAVVTCDAGENRLFMLHDFCVRSAGGLLQPNGGGGMGYAVPAAMGVALAEPGRPAVAVCGDGGYAMVLHGLMTAVEQNIPITVVVIDNRSLGWVLHSQGGDGFASEFHDFDLAGIAQAIGCRSQLVTTEQGLRDAVTTAAGENCVSVIVVQSNLEDSYQDIMAGRKTRAAG
jgi:acetolactate synthase I/II/III large subunit